MVRNYKRKTEDKWSKEDLLDALVNIRDGKIKINDAAKAYNISRATLYRQYKKFLQRGGKCDPEQFRTCGGNPILTKVEEDVLEKTIMDLREQGYTVTSSDIKRICFEYCDSNGIPNQFNYEKRMASDDWYYGFLKRHPTIRMSDTSSTSSKELKPGEEGEDGINIKDEPLDPLEFSNASLTSEEGDNDIEEEGGEEGEVELQMEEVEEAEAEPKGTKKRKASEGQAKGNAKKLKMDEEVQGDGEEEDGEQDEEIEEEEDNEGMDGEEDEEVDGDGEGNEGD